MTLATLNFQVSNHEHKEHTVTLEREPGSCRYTVKMDGSPVWEHQAGLLGFVAQFPLVGCRCNVQAVTLGGLFTRYKLSVRCPNDFKTS